MKKISTGLRLGTMLLDHSIISFISLSPIILYSFLSNPNHTRYPTPYSMIPFLVLYFCKDCLGGRSPAKRILKLTVVNNKTSYPANPFQSLIRNLFVIVWPIEILVSFFNRERRIGDRIAGTKLIYYNSETKRKSDFFEVLAAVLIAAFISFLLMKLFHGI